MRSQAKAATSAGTRSQWSLAAIPVLVALLALVFASGASAARYQRPFKETFGSAAQPSFEWPTSIVVDQQTGDVLVTDFFAGTLSRFHADGTPAPFAALGTNKIDGKEANGKPCSEEPASCDKTPQDGISISIGQNEMAIDESGGPTDGDIYLSEPGTRQVNIFAADGRYLGQLTETDHLRFVGVKGIAVDSSGAVYLTNSRVISKFVPSGNPVENSDFTGNIEAAEGDFLGQLAVGRGAASGSLFVGHVLTANVQRVIQLDPATGRTEFEFGDDAQEGLVVDPNTGNVLLGSGSEYEVPGDSQPQKVGRFIPEFGRSRGIAINSASELLTTEGVLPGKISVYGTPAIVPTVTADPASEVTGTKATFTGTVNPTGLPVTKCIFEYGSNQSGYTDEIPCEGPIPADENPHPVHATVSGLEPNEHGYIFRLVAFNENGQEETSGQTFTTAHTVVTEPATAVGQTAATLNGIVRPEGSPYSECFFEYGLSTNRSFEKTVPCVPGAAGIPGDFAPHEVKAAITGLQSGATYRYRLVATNGSLGTLAGEEQTFSTFGLPRIGEVQASNADQGSIVLEAKINPSGFGTSYRFEWGPTAAYGNLSPAEFEPFVGSGTEPILVKAKISGLAAGSTYHYRVIASSSRGTTRSPDHVAETLNSCGLPEARCFELVSRSQAGPVAMPGEANAAIEMHYQAATGGAGGLAYPVEGGYPEATKGADVLYRSLRGPQSWTSTQLSPPIAAVNERNDGVSVSSATQFLSDDLSCGITESVEPLTDDPSMLLAREEGAGNLYRINPDGSYTGITYLPPEGNVGNGLQNYLVAGASQNCGMVLFATRFVYPGVPAQSEGGSLERLRLYEWRDGTLHNAGIVPGPSGEVAVPASAGGANSAKHEPVTDTVNAVSRDGSRFFFTAERQTSSDPAEIGNKAVFVRENGSVTRDVSLSQTATPDQAALYQWATPDGSKVFFTANAGLAAGSTGGGAPCDFSNGEGCDLYEYDVETEELTDRSITAAAGGAEVAGFLGGSVDGSRVYFASRNQLVPGSGNSRSQNVAASTYSIYSEADDEISFVGTFNSREHLSVLTENGGSWSSQVSPDGRYLLFESSANVTGYESDDLRELYLYDAERGSQGTTCVSCRQDGQPPAENRYGNPVYELLRRGTEMANELHPPQFLTVRDGEPQVFFSSPDPLAPGAVPGQNNVYEWSHDQIFRLASALAGSQAQPTSAHFATFAGASEDGSDVYLVTPETLTWQDGDERLSAYDARIGGGYPAPPPSPAPCDPKAEDSCQATAQGGAATPGAASATFNGPGNPRQAEPHKKKAHKKKTKRHAKKKGSGKRGRHANSNRRAGK